MFHLMLAQAKFTLDVSFFQTDFVENGIDLPHIQKSS
jgi:hypothetical protein